MLPQVLNRERMFFLIYIYNYIYIPPCSFVGCFDDGKLGSADGVDAVPRARRCQVLSLKSSRRKPAGCTKRQKNGLGRCGAILGETIADFAVALLRRNRAIVRRYFPFLFRRKFRRRLSPIVLESRARAPSKSTV